MTKTRPILIDFLQLKRIQFETPIINNSDHCVFIEISLVQSTRCYDVLNGKNGFSLYHIVKRNLHE